MDDGEREQPPRKLSNVSKVSEAGKSSYASSSWSGARSFLGRGLASRTATDANKQGEPVKGDLGLTTLYQPEDTAVAELVFVHGLGGGSQKTWTADGDPDLYWPKEWLPQDAEFHNVRIHTYGYNSDWANDSVLNIHDFAKTLLIAIRDCPLIPRNAQTPIVFVAHSMGGLVIKRAYVLARQMELFKDIGDRIRAMLFLATPHQGSAHAKLLGKLLAMDFKGQRPYLKDLERGSQATQAITEEFANQCGSLFLRSFYETLPTKLAFANTMIVDKSAAALGLPNEQTQPINANHRNICKFSDQGDANYTAIRNAIASTLREVVIEEEEPKEEVLMAWRSDVNDFLGVNEPPEDDLLRRENLRVEGSCSWFLKKDSYKSWKNSPDPNMLWIQAKPAAGKSVLAGHIIKQLRDAEDACSFYFFDFNDKTKSSVSFFLRSIAWQMAAMDQAAMDTIINVMKKEGNLQNADPRTIWRKLYIEGLLKAKSHTRHFWVIDAADECSNYSDLIPFLLKAGETSHIRILVTCRFNFQSRTSWGSTKSNVISEEISSQDTDSDILRYIQANMDRLGYKRKQDRETLVSEILAKANGCFLWVRLVLDELSHVSLAGERHRILEEMPSDMDALYTRIVETLSERPPYGKQLTHAILVWATCCMNPLSTEQLKQALQLDLDDTIEDMERAIVENSGQLVYVDGRSLVQMVHATAREFLQHPAQYSEFAVEKKPSHERLALTCLSYLNGREMKSAGGRKLSATGRSQKKSAFASYAANAVFEHVSRASSSSDELIMALAKFFNSPNVLSWIEYIAETSRLDRLINAGKILRNFLRRRSEHSSLIGKEASTIQSWAIDLPRLATKFGKHLSTYPATIRRQIPPFCPQDSAIYRQFAWGARGLEVVGLESTQWDDCMSTVTFPDETVTALGSGDLYFAIGLASGEIILYNGETCQEVTRMDHGGNVRVLKFGDKSEVLASAGFKSIRVWDLDTRQELHKFDINKQCMQVLFVDDDGLLLAALKSNHLMTWNLVENEAWEPMDWTKDLNRAGAMSFPQPTAVAFSDAPTEQRILASVARGHDIIMWDIEEQQMDTTYGRWTGSQSRPGKGVTNATVWSLVFNPAPGLMMLAVAYSDGDLVTFDTSTGKVKDSREGANAHILAASPNGLTLATGDSAGTIQLFEFETLRLLYRITSQEHGIKSLSFNRSGTRLLDIRGSQCRIWDPVVLLRETEDTDDGSDNISLAPTITEATVDDSKEIILTTTVSFGGERDNFFFVGKEDGSVSLHDVDTGSSSGELYSHTGVPIVLLIYDPQSKLMTSVDSSSRIVSRKLVPDKSGRGWEVSEPLHDDRAGMAVDQVLSNKGHSLLLMSSTTKDVLYSISAEGGKVINSLEWEARSSYRWGTNPSDPDQLILIVNTTAYIYSFSELKPITEPSGIQLEYSVLPELSVMYFQYAFSSTMIASRWSDATARHRRWRLLLWQASDFTPTSEFAAPVPKFEPVANQVEYLIGSYNDRLVFMLSDGWVCSATEETFLEDMYTRHFFIPGHWLTSTRDLMISVSIRGDIVFVKHDEVAVIKGGLDMRYRGSVSD